jgi:hypothetical protein
VVPLTADHEGDVDDFGHYGGEYRIYHPDADPDPAAPEAEGAPGESGTP